MVTNTFVLIDIFTKPNQSFLANKSKQNEFMLVAIPVSMNAEVMMTVGDDSCNMKKMSIPKIFGGAECQRKWVGSFFGGV